MGATSPLKDDTTLVTTDGPVATRVPGETVILDADSGRYFGLDGVGSRVWELLATPTRFGDLVDAVVAEYDVERSRCEGDLRSLVADLRKAGLVTTTFGEDA